jgi:hypothetical protein
MMRVALYSICLPIRNPKSAFRNGVTRSLTLAVLFAFAVSAQSYSPQEKSSGAFQRAKALPADAPKEFDFALGRFSYVVKANGNGLRTKGDDARRFTLHFGPGEDIRYVYFAGHQGGLLLTCEVLSEYGGTSYAVRLDQPSMRARWTTNIPATETGEPARDGSRLYVTGRNFAGALDLETGDLLWYLDKFPGLLGEVSFDAPEPRGREVLFRTRPVYNGAARTFVVDSKTGKIVRVE